jgi:hypothetical protein
LIILIIHGEVYKPLSSSLFSFSTLPSPYPSYVQISSSVYVPPLMSETKFHTHTYLTRQKSAHLLYNPKIRNVSDNLFHKTPYS